MTKLCDVLGLTLEKKEEILDEEIENLIAERQAARKDVYKRQGFYCADIHDSKEGAPVFNRIVSLKSSFRLPK